MIGRVTLVLVSSLVSVILAEALARAVLNPVDWLQPKVIPDQQLGHRIEAGTGGHDSNGFRNSDVPDESDILAVGDSMTYGVAAIAAKAWPKQLSQITNRSVYSAALGGYGPLQYKTLAERHIALQSPNLLIVGLYLGNDLFDAYNLAYTNDSWASYRDTAYQTSDATAQEIDDRDPAGKRFASIRKLLAHNSVLYSAITKSFIGELVRDYEAKERAEKLSVTVGGRKMFFDLKGYEMGLNPNAARITEGIRLSKAATAEIAALTKEAGVDCLFVLIPTKFAVYDRVLRQQLSQSTYQRILEILENEARVTELMRAHLVDQGVQVIDPLPSLQSAIAQAPIYPPHDTHPTEVGYEIIARLVADNLPDQGTSNRRHQ